MTALDLSDVQGNIARGYRHEHYRQLFGTVTGDAKAWRAFLGDLAGRVTHEKRSRVRGPAAVNVGISYAGLAALVPELASDLAVRFPAFAAGMGERADDLGDRADAEWPAWARRHIWVSVHAVDAKRLEDDEVPKLLALAERRGLTLDPVGVPGVVIHRNGGRAEHFGFRDGLSNPVFEGVHAGRCLEGNGKKTEDGRWVPIATGEFLMGYPNEQGRNPLDDLPPAAQQVLRNGTFAVLRVLEQDVAGFHEYVAAATERYPLPPGEPDVAERMVGRTRDGRPLVAPHRRNDFDYREDDPQGVRCPLGAHIRRANPRVSGEHRILRRGIPFGTFVERGDRAEGCRGIYFIAFNASIENQFEFLQRFYLNGLGAGRQTFGTVGGARDPLAAAGEGPRRMAIEGDRDAGRDPILLLDVPQFVDCTGGEYYLVPGMAGLRAIAGLRDDAPARVFSAGASAAHGAGAAR